MDPFTLYLVTAFASGAMQATGNAIQIGSQAAALGQSAYARMFGVNALERSAAQDIETMQEQGEAFKSTQRLVYLNSGVDITSGTPLKVLTDTAYKIEKDIQTYRYNVETEKAQQLMTAYNERKQAKEIRKLGPLSVMMPLLQTGANMALSSGYGTKAGR